MSTRDALLKAVLASPDDDLPRLAFADHLDELAGGSSPRAELIRFMCHYKNSYAETGGRTDLVSMFGIPVHEWFPKLPASVNAVVSRGFISEIHCTLADWCGGRCDVCDGSGGIREHLPDGGFRVPLCERCGGQGRTAGIGPRLVREHPVRVVTLTDRDLADDRYFTDLNPEYQTQWWWTRLRPDSATRGLPPELWQYVSIPTSDTQGRRSVTYPTRELALSALSEACLKWAKSQPEVPAPDAGS